MSDQRIQQTFMKLAQEKRPALVTFLTAGDPNYETSLATLKQLPAAGCDVMEIGMPFSDPMADGPSIQRANIRALTQGQTLKKTLEMVAEIRKENNETPIVLMGYYNPIWSYGVERFLDDANNAGVDGLIIVDLPPEMDNELCLPALSKGINFIRLATPTTDDKRLPKVLENTSGFVYYVSITGITGSSAFNIDDVASAVTRIKGHTELPVVVGFGIRTPEHAKLIGEKADGVVVGSVLVEAIENSLDKDGKASATTVSSVTNVVNALSKSLR